MKIVCISDTHGSHDLVSVPEGDVLVHAGDLTAHGSHEDYLRFIQWFSTHPHPHKVFIAGNHDGYLEEEPEKAKAEALALGLIYLSDSGVEINGVHFWGSPITPQFHDWSFMRSTQDIKYHWSLIPLNTDVLITHGPVWGVLDEVERSPIEIENTGCPSLAERVEEIQPAVHVFGHIHEGYGSLLKGKTHFLNVSTMNKQYRIQNEPVIFEL